MSRDDHTTHDLPPRVEIDQLLEQLDDRGLREFQREILDAVYNKLDDARINKILGAWHKSLRFLAQPDFKAKLARSQEDIKALTGT